MQKRFNIGDIVFHIHDFHNKYEVVSDYTPSQCSIKNLDNNNYELVVEKKYLFTKEEMRDEKINGILND